MKRYMKVLIAVCLATLILVPVSSAIAAEKPGFVGAWEATDPIDDSYEKMVISGGGNGVYRVMLHDWACWACWEQPLDGCTAIGQGTADGNTLTADLTVRCLGCRDCEINGAVYEFTFIYDPLTDLITDPSDPPTVWSRLGRR